MRSEMYLIPAFCVRNQPFIKIFVAFFCCHRLPFESDYNCFFAIIFFRFCVDVRANLLLKRNLLIERKTSWCCKKKATGNGEIWNTLQKRALHRRSAGSLFFSSLISIPALIKIRRKKVVCTIEARAGS